MSQSSTGQLWNPLETLGIRDPGDERCCAALNKQQEPCGYRIDSDQREDIRDILRTMSEKPPQETIDDLPRLVTKTLCSVHSPYQSKVQRITERWTDVVLNMPPTPASSTSSPRSGRLYTLPTDAPDTPSRPSRFVRQPHQGTGGNDMDGRFRRLEARMKMLEDELRILRERQSGRQETTLLLHAGQSPLRSMGRTTNSPAGASKAPVEAGGLSVPAWLKGTASASSS